MVFGYFVDLGLSSFFMREETFEDEMVCRQSGVDESWDEGCGAWETLDFCAETEAFSYEKESRVGDAWSAGVGDESHTFASSDTLGKRGDNLMFVIDMKSRHRFADAVMS